MGEAKQRKSATKALIESYPRCALCGGLRATTTRDHIPPTAIFDRSHRPNGLVVPACEECNQGSRTSDLVAAMVSRWKYDANETELADHHRLSKRIAYQAPEIIKEWTSIGERERHTALSHLSRYGVSAPKDAALSSIGPLTIPHLTLFAHKVTLALYFARVGRGLPENGVVTAYWRTKEDFRLSGLPKEIVSLLPTVDFLKQGSWTTRDAFEYRYAYNERVDFFGCASQFRNSLYVVGFATGNPDEMINAIGEHWLTPPNVLEVLTDVKHKKRRQ